MSLRFGDTRRILPELPDRERAELFDFIAGSERAARSPEDVMDVLLASLALKQHLAGTRPN